MKTFLTIIIISSIALIISGCCSTHDCEDPISLIKVRLLKDGTNALYGPNAVLTKSSLHLSTLSGASGYEDYIEFDDANESIGITIHEFTPTLLKLSSIRTDTFTITTEFVEPTKNCDCGEYRVTSVSRNGVVICMGLCEDVIDIEI